MKIYPNNFEITTTDKVNNFIDIPLAYIDADNKNYTIELTIKDEFEKHTKEEILPYEDIGNSLICLFDKQENLIDYKTLNENIKREKDKYIYIPKGSIVFNPKTFVYKIIGKKNMVYESKNLYNIKVSTKNKCLNNYLMPIFGQANYENLAPTNVLVNNGDMSSNSLNSNTYNDFMFAKMIDDKIDIENNILDIEKELEKNTNLFLIYDTSYSQTTIDDSKTEIQLYKDTNTNTYYIKNPILNSSLTYETNNFFIIPKDTDEIIYHNIFENYDKKTPILIEERIGKGFVIHASNNLIKDITDKSNLIYEVLLYIYLKAYLVSNKIEEWITDTVPDFVVKNNKKTKTNYFSSDLELYKMFNLKENEISLYKIDIDEKYPFVKFKGLNNNYLIFEKDLSNSNKEYSDPVKPENAISIYTSRKNIIYYQNNIFKINESLNDKIILERNDNVVDVTILPFKNSNHNIFFQKKNNFQIKLDDIEKEVFYIISKKNESTSFPTYINEKFYDKNNGPILAVIEIKKDIQETKIYDMRKRGGGLPLSEKDNFDCFDIGHILGRPYRKAATLIITLPKHLEKHKEIIYNTVKQYCIAEEYVIIKFKEE